MSDNPGFECIGWLTVVLGALNVALNTWLVHRRAMADRREVKRNGTPDPAFEGVPKSVAQTERDASAGDNAKKE